jgi:hypothetical protein
MPWTPYSDTVDYMPYKVLARDDDGDPILRLMRMQPYDIGEERAKPAYHTAREMMFFIDGEMPKWECDPDELVICRAADWWDRLPGSVHIGGTPAAAVSCEALLWMTADDDPFVGIAESGSLISGLDSKSAVERTGPDRPSLPVESPAPRGAYRVDRPLMKLIDTRALRWEPHPWLFGAQVKTLSRRADGDPTVTITWIPPGAYPVASLPVRMAADYREFSFALAGELRIVECAASDGSGIAVHLRPGYFVDRAAGSVFGFDAGPSSTGATLLQWRLRNGSQMVKDSDKYTHTVVVER